MLSSARSALRAPAPTPEQQSLSAVHNEENKLNQLGYEKPIPAEEVPNGP